MAEQLRRTAAWCLLCCALFVGCSANLPQALPTPESELDAMQAQADLYAREIEIEEIDFSKVPRICDGAHFNEVWREAMERRVSRLVFVTEDWELTLPGGGAELAHLEGLQALTPHVWQDKDGLYLVVYEITRYEGENAAYAYLDGQEASLSRREKELLEKAKMELQKLKAELSEYEKLVALHDLVRAAGSYKSVDLSENRLIDEISAYGLLMEGQANCQGYADAMQLLCLLAGIPCRKVSGKANGGEHVWNLVLIEGKWLHVDVTFDDCFFGNALPCYVYLGTDEELLSKTHTWDPESLPEEVTGELFYYEHYGLVVEEGKESLVQNAPAFLYKGDLVSAKNAFSSYACREFGEYLAFSQEG